MLVVKKLAQQRREAREKIETGVLWFMIIAAMAYFGGHFLSAILKGRF